MIGRIVAAARRRVRVRLFVPAKANNWACAVAEQFHHQRLLYVGGRILGYPKMLHVKAFVADGEQGLAGTWILEAWSRKWFFEIDVGFESSLAAEFHDRFLASAEPISSDVPPPSNAEGARLSSRIRGDLATPVAALV